MILGKTHEVKHRLQQIQAVKKAVGKKVFCWLPRRLKSGDIVWLEHAWKQYDTDICYATGDYKNSKRPIYFRLNDPDRKPIISDWTKEDWIFEAECFMRSIRYNNENKNTPS